jgi:hypothetical protein
MRKTIFTVGLLVATAAVVLLSPLTDPAFGDAGEPPRSGSPIIVDIYGDGYHLTSPIDGVNFDVNVNGYKERTAWANVDDAFLVLDRNGNGKIDDGRELFGDRTDQPPSSNPNGWSALAVFDVNHDNRIDATDPIFSSLRLWIDNNKDGFTRPGELTPLSGFNVTYIDLSIQWSPLLDGNGNEFRYLARVAANTYPFTWNHVAYDVFLKRDGPP